MTQSRLLDMPRMVEWAIRVERTPSLAWLACVAVALLPTWIWMAQRMLDRSDDPLGLLAIAALAVLCWQCRQQLRASPRLGWLATALAAALASTLAIGLLPPLLVALLAVTALGAALAAFLPSRVDSAPVLGLSLLSLPWLASLQFYAGYPLRVLTAEASRWLLAPFFAVGRDGSALRVDGHMVIVDAPCSGVQMLWLAYFTACVVALATGRTSRSFLTRLPAVSACVLAGNIVRNTLLVALEACGHGASGPVHEAVGLVVLAEVCGAIAWVMDAREPGHV
ncbi:exosortase Q [Ramlibacter ginsenosidimutans]|uniref:Exosortase Q n=1 Tax=Ramlibacter ginsenosidimutans TaxID=502333 RepID=A0A934TXS9_9BURK|nr:exosortase Q [Ramlibacter ginsenosidimutans]MBK6009221.1 exosortase Q [Ramlibacter ginsenosidimutans]